MDVIPYMLLSKDGENHKCFESVGIFAIGPLLKALRSI